MNLPKKFLSGPIQPHCASPDILMMRWHDGEHCPDNKRSGQVDSICEIEFTRFAGREDKPGWLQIQTLEMTTSREGRTTTRTITTVVSLEQAEMIARFINTGSDSK